jgi:hypothetical protein
LDDQKLAEVAQQGAYTQKQAADKAAAAELLKGRNKFDLIPAKQQEAVAKHAAAFGISKDTLTKGRPDLLTGITDKQAKEQLVNEERIRLEDKYALASTPQERDKFVKRDLAQYKPSDVAVANKRKDMEKAKIQERKLGSTPVSDDDVKKRATDDERARLEGKYALASTPQERDKFVERDLAQFKPSTAQLSGLKEKMVIEKAKEKTLDFTHATREDARQNLISEEAKKLKASGKTGSELDTALKTYGDSIMPAQIDTELTRFNQEKENEAIKKLTVSRFREIPKSQIDANLVEQSNYGTFSRSYLEFTTEQKEAYKETLPALRSKVFSELGLKAGTTIGDVKKAVEKLEKSKVLAEQEKGRVMRELVNKVLLVKG